ncbi:hypothetical protein HL42_3500 [Trichophyton rubrum]|nr:hypothetical protein HL42_3500 [Trichophyton rubrum]
MPQNSRGGIATRLPQDHDLVYFDFGKDVIRYMLKREVLESWRKKQAKEVAQRSAIKPNQQRRFSVTKPTSRSYINRLLMTPQISQVIIILANVFAGNKD